MKICIVSDSHDRAEALAQAVRDASAEGAIAIIHCGDVIGTQTLRATMRLGLPLHVIHGNNLGDPVSLSRLSRESDGTVQYHGADARIELGGRRIFVVNVEVTNAGRLVATAITSYLKLQQNAQNSQ